MKGLSLPKPSHVPDIWHFQKEWSHSLYEENGSVLLKCSRVVRDQRVPHLPLVLIIFIRMGWDVSILWDTHCLLSFSHSSFQLFLPILSGFAVFLCTHGWTKLWRTGRKKGWFSFTVCWSRPNSGYSHPCKFVGSAKFGTALCFSEVQDINILV